MKIWVLSDTHGFHQKLKPPTDYDMVIHCGDISNSPNLTENFKECLDFLKWFDNLEVETKILVPGNHDKSYEYRHLLTKEYDKNKHVLIHDYARIKGLRIFGSPYTPSYGDCWSFNKARNKIGLLWDQIPKCDILITHGPPQGILDLTYDFGGEIVQVGCKSLYNKVVELDPAYHLFGHIHREQGLYNTGTRNIIDCSTTFVNASCWSHRTKDLHNGFVLEI